MTDQKRTKMGTGPVTAMPAIQTPTPAGPAPTDPPDPQPRSYVPDQPDALLGQTLAGRYVIVRKLGEGGMGAVYLATHTALEKHVALKVLHGEFARKPDLVERFMQEAKAASRIRHENVIDISDFGQTPEGLVFFAMELLSGRDLHEEIARARLSGELLPWARTKKIFLQICSALSAAHAKRIIHRDLKPENVYLVEFLGDPDFVKLLDFGIAKLTEVTDGERKLTRTGMLFGTPEYMSPEQARGEQVDHRVDVYAMGCILFQMVTGRVPFEAENFMGVLSLHLTEPPPMVSEEVLDRIGAPRELAVVIDRALDKDRNARWQTIDELANAVRTISGDPPVAGPRPHTPSVPAPISTVTSRAKAPTGPGSPRPGSVTGRQRTQWTGNLQVPTDEDEQAPQRRSKLPIVLGGVGIVVVGAIVTIVALWSHAPEPAAPGSAIGSAAIAAPVGSPSSPGPGSQATAAPQPPTPAPALPARVKFVINSNPNGADVVDLSTNAVIGKTPSELTLPGSTTPRQYAIRKRGYRDTVVELVPNQDGQQITEKLVKGEGPAVHAAGTGSAAPTPSGPGSAATTPEPGPTIKPEPGPTTHPDSGSAKPPDDDTPTLKPFGNGSAGS